MGIPVRLKGKTEAELIAENPVLLDRQLCFATDKNNFKVGPGEWNSLDYWIGGGTPQPARYFVSEADLNTQLDPESEDRYPGEYAFVQGTEVVTIYTWNPLTSVWDDTGEEVSFIVKQSVVAGDTDAISGEAVYQYNQAFSLTSHTHSTAEAWLAAIVNALVASEDLLTMMNARLSQGPGINLTIEDGKIKITNTGDGEAGIGDFEGIGGEPLDNDALATEFAKYLKKYIWKTSSLVGNVRTFDFDNVQNPVFRIEPTEDEEWEFINVPSGLTEFVSPFVRIKYSGISSFTATLPAGIHLEDGTDNPISEIVFPTGKASGYVTAAWGYRTPENEYTWSFGEASGTSGPGATDLGASLSASNVIVTSNTGTDATIPPVDGTNAGVVTPAQKATWDAAASESTAGNAEILTQAETDAETDDARILTAKKLSEKAVYRETFSPILTFTKNNTDSERVNQSANITLDADFTGAKHGAIKVIRINGDNASSVTFTSKFQKEVDSKDFDNTKYNKIYCEYDADADIVFYQVAHYPRIVSDTTPPTIISANRSGNNTYVDLTLSEGGFTNSNGTGGITASDLTLTFFQNGGTASNVVIASVKRNDSPVAGSASSLVGGESTVRAFLTTTGSPNGNEYFTVKPASGSSIYDAAGNAMSSAQTTGNITLAAVDLTPPTITSGLMAAPNSYIDVLFNEGVYSDTSLNPPVSSDFSLTFTQGAGTATAASITSVTTTSGGALGGGESTIRFNLLITGTPNGAETIAIAVASGSSIYDAAGNAMASGQTTGPINLNNNTYSANAIQVINRMSGTLSTSLKNDMAALVDALTTSGNFAKTEEMVFAPMDSEVNALRGWMGRYNGTNVGCTWNAGSNFESSGANYLNTGFTPSAAVLASLNNMFIAVFIKEWGHASGVTKVLFGCSDGTRSIYLSQSSSVQLNRAFNSTPASFVFNNAEAVFANNALYGAYRVDSANVGQIKNGGSVDSDALASNGLVTRPVYVMARNNSGTADLFANCKVYGYIIGQAVGYDFASLYSAVSTFLASRGA
jgi:hypothetical protein